MANSVTHAALPFPVKGCRFTLQVPYLDADGDPTDPTTPDTERSIDAGAFADCTEEVSTISGTNGVGYITLTGDETNGSMVSLAAKVASGPKATLATLYPRVLPVVFSGTAQAGAAGTITLATDIPAVANLLIGCIVRTTGGTGGAGGSGSQNNQARVITAFSTGRVATVVPNWETTPDNTTTYEVLLTEFAIMRYSDIQLLRGSQVNSLISGRFDANVQAMANDVVTAAAIADNAIDAGAIASNAITAAKIASDAITAAKIADGAIDAATFAAGAIDSAAIATDAIGSAEISAAAVTKIQSGLSTYAGGDTPGTTTLLSRLTSARAGYLDNLSGGAVALASKLTKYVQLALRKDSAIATDNSAEVTEINANGGSGGGAYANTTDAQEALRDRGDTAWTTATGFSTLDAAGVRSAVGLASANLDTQLGTIDDFLDTEIAAIKAKTDNLPASPASEGNVTAVGNAVAALNDLSATDVENAVWDADITTHNVADSAGEALQDAGAAGTPPTAGEIADAVWDESLAAHNTSGSTGEALGAAGGAGDPWITALPGAYSAGQAGYIVGTNLNATVSSRATQASVDAVDDFVDTEVGAIKAKTDQLTFTVANQVDANALRIEGVDATNQIRDSVLSDATRFAGANIDAAISSRSTLDGTGVQSALTAQGYTSARAGYMDVLNGIIAAIWSYATRILTAGTNIVLAKGTGVTGFNDLSAAQVNAEADTALADVGLTSTVTGRIDVAVSSRLASAGYTTPPTVTQIRQEMDSNSADLDTIISNQTTINSNVLSRASQVSLDTMDDYVDTEVAAIKAKTDNLPANPAAVSDIPTANQNADALLKRDMSAVSGEALRSLLNVARLFRNKVVISGGTMTVYKEDDTTIAWTAVVGTDSGAEPIVSVDP